MYPRKSSANSKAGAIAPASVKHAAAQGITPFRFLTNQTAEGTMTIVSIHNNCRTVPRRKLTRNAAAIQYCVARKPSARTIRKHSKNVTSIANRPG